MELKEWKYHRNKKVKQLKKIGCSIEEIGDILCIDQNLINQILKGDFDSQTKYWERRKVV